VLGVAAALAVAAPPAAASTPTVRQLVVFRDGHPLTGSAKARKARVKVGHRKCTVGAATPLAALAALHPPKLRLRDYGSCGKRARDAGSLYVRSIGGDAAKGLDGWVYKVGNRLATAGAGDPSGPFGNGRLKKGARVTWFYCHMDADTHSCQPTLGVTADAGSTELVHAHVTAYDDRGRAKPAAGATVHAGDTTATTDSNGDAQFVVPPGRYSVFADRDGSVRSFDRVVDVN
jgi:hypothetical protein